VRSYGLNSSGWGHSNSDACGRGKKLPGFFKGCAFPVPLIYCQLLKELLLSGYVCDYRRGLDWWMDLLITYTHNSELQAITAPPLISTIHKSPQHPLSLLQPAVSFPAVPWWRLLTVEILRLQALRFYLNSITCRTASVKIKIMLRPTVSRSVCLGANHPEFYYCQTVACLLMWGALSLRRGRVCRLQLLLALANAVIFGSESRRTRGHILLSQIRDFPFRRLLRLASELCSLFVISRNGPHRKYPVSNSNFIVDCVFVASGTYLPKRCPETVVVYRVTE
jgi:hypothetical protein